MSSSDTEDFNNTTTKSPDNTMSSTDSDEKAFNNKPARLSNNKMSNYALLLKKFNEQIKINEQLNIKINNLEDRINNMESKIKNTESNKMDQLLEYANKTIDLLNPSKLKSLKKNTDNKINEDSDSDEPKIRKTKCSSKSLKQNMNTGYDSDEPKIRKSKSFKQTMNKDSDNDEPKIRKSKPFKQTINKDSDSDKPKIKKSLKQNMNKDSDSDEPKSKKIEKYYKNPEDEIIMICKDSNSDEHPYCYYATACKIKHKNKIIKKLKQEFEQTEIILEVECEPAKRLWNLIKSQYKDNIEFFPESKWFLLKNISETKLLTAVRLCE
jgi:hypothetical protein